MGVVQMKAGCATRDFRWAWFRLAPGVPAWYCAGVVGTCYSQPKRQRPDGAPNMPLQPTASREIVGFLTRLLCALAAAERQPVRRQSGKARANCTLIAVLVQSTQ